MEHLREILDKFSGRKILIIGDIMLDKYIHGSVSRINPEAPVPVLKIEKEFNEIGGTGNVASNITSLKGQATIFSFVGKDKEAEILKKMLLEKKIDYFLDEDEITVQKMRIIGRGQQIVRVDKEETYPKIFKEETKKIILEKAREADMIIISDYAKGTITKDLMNLLYNFKKKMIIHPKPTNKNLSYEDYKNVLLIIPNEKEAFELSDCSNIYEAGEKLRKELNSNILVTRGEKGMSLFSDIKTDIPTCARDVYDVQGASDTVVAAVSLAISAGSSLEEAGIIGNHAAGIAVEKKGTYCVKLNELKSRILIGEKKIVNFEELKSLVEYHKSNGNKIAWTNGCFDVLHSGHRYSLEKAKEKGDILIVGLDSDASVRKLKGPERPIYNEKERADLLSSVRFVDYIIIFQYGEVAEFLRILKPDVYVKSGNYTLDTINQEERKIIEDYGGEIFLPKGIPGISTTDIIEKIRNSK